MERRQIIPYVVSIGCAALLCGCRGVRYVEREVPVEVERVTERVVHDVVRDTTLERDSVFVAVRGDTVVVERWRERVRTLWRERADTVRDTVPRVVTLTRTETVEVERPVPWWRTALQWLGAAALAAGALAVAWRARR